MVYSFGPYLPGNPAVPAKKASSATPAKPDTSFFAGILGASGRSTPDPVLRYVPSSAKPGKTLYQADASNTAAVNAGLVPKPTNVTIGTPVQNSTSMSTLGTGSIESQTAPTTGASDGGVKEKPLSVTLPQEDMQAVQNAADALRLFQENQAKAQLTNALAAIDRSAIEQYTGIANDYAARGLARSGGKLMTERKAEDAVSRTKAEAEQAVTDFLDELKFTGNLEQAKTNLSKSSAFQQWINSNYEGAGS